MAMIARKTKFQHTDERTEGMAKLLQHLNMLLLDLRSSYKGYSEVKSWTEISGRYRCLDFVLPVPAELSCNKNWDPQPLSLGYHFLMGGGEGSKNSKTNTRETSVSAKKCLREVTGTWGREKNYISWKIMSAL